MTLRQVGLSLLAVIAAVLGTAPARAAESGSPTALRVMTFNLRYASTKQPNAWPDRRPVLRDCVRQVAPDLMGTQEGLYSQLKDIAADLPEYTWIGTGRDG